MRKEYPSKFLMFCLGGILVLFLLEAVLYLVALPYRNRAIASGGARNKDTYVILCIGDSFVYGLGAPENKSYPRQLEDMLNQTRFSKKVKVVNAGMPGKNIFQISERFRNDIDTIKPDLVIFLGGMINHSNLYGYHAFIGENAGKPTMLDCLYRVRVFKLAKYIIGNIIEAGKEKAQNSTEHKIGQNAGLDTMGPLARKYYKQGCEYLAAGKNASAGECFRKSAKLEPARNPSYRFLGMICELNGDYDTAIEFYEKSLRRRIGNADNTFTCFALGNLYCRKNRFDKAFQTFRQGVEYDPSAVLSFNPNYEGLISLSQNEKASHLHKPIEEFLGAIKGKANSDYQTAIEDIERHDFANKIEQWKMYGVNNIIAVCKKHRTPIILQDYPEWDDGGWYRKIAEMNGLPFVCHSQVFAGLKNVPRNVYFSSDANHCNANGYRIMAQDIYNKIMELKIIQ